MEKLAQKRWEEAGVRIDDPATTRISAEARVGRGTAILPHTVIEGPVSIGERCEIGPFARLRGATSIGDDVRIGNFVEIVRSRIGSRTRILHLSFIGDAEIGTDVNIGAGTITANSDGAAKHKTVIGDGASIGSGTILVAPVAAGDRSRTGAGAVVTRGKDIAAGETVAGVPARPLSKDGPR